MSDNRKKPHISVIMPAYNAGKYLEGSVGSIIRQTYDNFSLLIIDDGSADNTGAVISKLSEKDGRVKGITVQNGGPANARNKGLDIVLADEDTEYVMFADADDEYLSDAFEKAVAAADKDTGIVFMGFTIVNPDGTMNDYCEPDGVYTTGTLGNVFHKLYTANLLNQVWGKLFSAEMLREKKFRFPDYRWGEDRLFIYDCLEASSKIAVLSYCGYLYKMYNASSLISGYYDFKPEVCKISDRRVIELCRLFNESDEADCRYMFLKSVFSCLTNVYSPSCKLSRAEKREYAKKILNDEYILNRIKGTGGGTAAKILSVVMSTKNVSLNLLTAKIMTDMSASAPLLFQKIKHKK